MQLFYNAIFPSIIEKQKTLDANERSAYQLLELFDKNKDKPKSYTCTAKSHATLFPKKLYSTLFGRFEILDEEMWLESDKNLYSFYF